MKTSSLFVASFALVAAACGGGKKDPPVMVIDAPKAVDAAPACTGPATFTAPTTYLQKAYNADYDTMTTGAQEVWRVIGAINADAMPDLLWVELWEGPPPLTVANFPATPFTIQLAGADLNYFTCSACVSLTTDDNGAEEGYADDFMATGGSITITTLSPTMIAGTIDNVQFKQVDFDFDNDTQMDNASGCTVSQTGSLAFSTPVMMPMAFSPDGNTHGRRRFGIRLK